MGLIFNHDGYVLDQESEKKARSMAIAKVLCEHREEFGKALLESTQLVLKLEIEKNK